VSLATTTNRLEASWTVDQRRNPPWPRWAEQQPALRLPPVTIRERLADRDREVSGPILAALVRLATGGDHQAANLVTLSLLPRMVRAEQRRTDNDSYDQLAGLLWEAIVTVTNPDTPSLRETIERNAWRRKRRVDQPLRGVRADFDGPVRHCHRTLDDGINAVHLRADLRRLQCAGTISAPTRQLLEQLADDDQPPTSGPNYEAARKKRWRTLSQLRNTSALRELLTA